MLYRKGNSRTVSKRHCRRFGDHFVWRPLKCDFWGCTRRFSWGELQMWFAGRLARVEGFGDLQCGGNNDCSYSAPFSEPSALKDLPAGSFGGATEVAPPPPHRSCRCTVWLRTLHTVPLVLYQSTSESHSLARAHRRKRFFSFHYSVLRSCEEPSLVTIPYSIVVTTRVTHA